VETIPAGFPGADHACRIVTAVDRVAVLDCQQEVSMFDEFAALARGQGQGQGAGGRVLAWQAWTRATQAVVEALRESMGRGGEAVDVHWP
jgi:hypothetical protein